MPIDPNLPAEFFELVGRIVVSAAIFEDELATLAARIDDPGTLDADAEGESDLTQAVLDYKARLVPHAGEFATTLIKQVRAQGVELVPDIYTGDFTEYLGRAEEAFAGRHDLVHNVWIYRGDEHADYIGMRGLPRRKREDANEPYTSTQVKHSDLVALLAEFDNLSHWLHIWSGRIDTFGARGAPPEA